MTKQVDLQGLATKMNILYTAGLDWPLYVQTATVFQSYSMEVKLAETSELFEIYRITTTVGLSITTITNYFLQSSAACFLRLWVF